MNYRYRLLSLGVGLPLLLGPLAGCDGGVMDPVSGEQPAAGSDRESDAPDAPEARPGDGEAVPGEEAAPEVRDPNKRASQTRAIERRLMPEPGLLGEHNYIVHLADEPLATYRGGVAGLAATNPAAAGIVGKLDAKSPASLAYKSFLDGEQSQMLLDMRALLQRPVSANRRYVNAINAVTVRMSQDEAQKVAMLPGVSYIERDQAVLPETDRGPGFIGAASIWDGLATGLPHQGEGLTVGIIDSGIAFQVEIDGVLTDHPSFSEVGDDGFVHTNPLGDGVFLGGCIDNPEWCNNKLIGVYNMLQAQPTPGVDPAAPDDDPIWGFKDTDGHGSHVASTAVGNVLFDVPQIDADGNPSTFAFERISGVAPHASVVAFKVCAPSCFFSDIAASVEQAIEDGVVDALNQSIGSGAGNPWRVTSAQAFLSARAAGIFVATSAGNSGPDAGTAARGNSAPWIAGVAASAHDRRFPDKFVTDMAGGDTPPPPDLVGLAVSGGTSGRIVYAGDFPVGSPGEPNFDQPEQCLEPFPAGTFAADMIVVCDRGAIARVAKGQNVRDGGAGGLILANLPGGASSVVADPHVIPSIHIDAAQGDLLRAWLATGSGHTGTVTATEQPVGDPSVADIMAAFSSRGPFTDFDFIAPQVAAPGLRIFAAGAQFNHPGGPSVPNLFGTIQGTSMASPHVAGSSLLMQAVRPGWTQAEILSALMTTGQTDLLKEDGVTPADPFDYGGGRVQLFEAARAGLVFDETAANFAAGDPDIGGDPRTLNVAALVEESCIGTCSWERTVRATQPSSWTVTTSSFVTAEPASFTLAENELLALSFSADVEGLAPGEFTFGTVTFTPDNPELSEQTMQVAVQANRSNVARAIEVTATRDADSVSLDGLRAISIEQLSAGVFGLDQAETEVRAIGGDSGNGSPYDDLDDGVTFKLVPFPDFAQQFIAETFDSSAPDLDLFVGLDFNGDGLPSADEEFCASTTATAVERCVFDLGGDLSGFPPFWILVQSFTPSAPGAVDGFTMATTGVGLNPDLELDVVAPSGSIPSGEPFEISLRWDGEMSTGELFYGRVAVFASAEQSEASFLGNVDLRLERGLDDVRVSLPERTQVGEFVEVTTLVSPNFTSERRDYQIEVPLPPGTSYRAGSADADGGSFDGDSVNYQVARLPTAPGAGSTVALRFEMFVPPALKGLDLAVNAANTVDRPDTDVQVSGDAIQVQAYTEIGFLEPFGDGSVVSRGDTVLVTFQVVDVETKGFVFGDIADVHVRDASGNLVLADSFEAAFFGFLDYNLDTTPLAAGTYTLTAVLDDGFDYSMSFTVVE
ncbi:MAG: S8 family serine peptidase [Haliangiales bacterium]